jgi:hypothetical protein
MPTQAEIKEQVASESERRTRLAVPAFAGGVLYMLSAVIISATLNGAPTVGLLQGLQPALEGVTQPTVSPRTPEIKFISHHALTLIAGSVIAAVAILALTLILLLLTDATRFRRPQLWAAARPLVLFGGISVAIVSVAHQVVSAVETHNFAVGHDFSTHAVEQALTTSTANEVIAYVDLLAGLALAAGMIVLMLNTLRVGLLPRWMTMLGMVSGLLLFLPIGGAELQVIPSLWMVMIGILFIGKWPNGEPEAWSSGEARPFPTAAQRRAEAAGGAPAGGAIAAPAPAPVVVQQAGTSRKRRKR